MEVNSIGLAFGLTLGLAIGSKKIHRNKPCLYKNHSKTAEKAR